MRITPKDKFLKSFKATILDVREEEYIKINANRKTKIKSLEELKGEKIKLIDMKKRELLPDDDFKEAFNALKQKIEDNEINLSETKLEEFDLNEAVDRVFEYIKTLPENWEDAGYLEKTKLQGLIFKEKPLYDFKTFQTPKLCPILQTEKDLAYAKFPFVPLRGIEPRLPG